jgi:hypothetical protein
MSSSTAFFKGLFMVNHYKLQKVAIATSMFLGLATAQLNSIAQAADSATLNVSGQITSTTCNILISDPGGTGATGTKVLNLGNVATSTGATGSVIGNPVGAIFSVVSTGNPSTPCTFQGGNTKWDLALALSSSQISSIGTSTFLKNNIAAASGGTDAVVQLKGGVGTTLAAATNTLTLQGDQGIGGTLMSGGSTLTAASTSSIAISAQFVRSAAAAPTGGAFSQTIPLLARYN